MSGGSYLYAYRTVEDFAEAIEANRTLDGRDLLELNSKDRVGFARHLRRVAAAMQAIEWVDSSDCSPPHDTEAIKAALPIGSFECGARKQGTAGGNDPASCDWPACGCDAYASEVLFVAGCTIPQRTEHLEAVLRACLVEVGRIKVAVSELDASADVVRRLSVACDEFSDLIKRSL